MTEVPPHQTNDTSNKPASSKTARDKLVSFLSFASRWPKITSASIFFVFFLIYIAIIMPIMRDKNLVETTPEKAGQAFCTNDTAHLKMAAYKKDGQFKGIGLYTKNPSSSDAQFAQKALGYITGNSTVDSALKDGFSSISQTSLVACITQTDAGDSQKTCSPVTASEEVAIHKTKNTIKLYEGKTHKLIAEKELPGLPADKVNCNAPSPNTTIDYTTISQAGHVVYSPVDGEQLAKFLQSYL